MSPTSDSTDFNVTTATIIEDALLLLGAQDAEESVQPADNAKARRMLNMLVQTLATTADLWVKVDVTHTLTPGQPSYDVRAGAVAPGVYAINTPRPLRLRAARRSDGTTELPIEVVDRKRYMGIPDKATQGPPLLVYYDPQIETGKLYVWQTGDTTWDTLILTFQRPIEDMDVAGDNPDFPKEWHLCLVYNLARLLLPSYPTSEATRIESTADALLTAIKAHDAEDEPIQFVPEW